MKTKIFLLSLVALLCAGVAQAQSLLVHYTNGTLESYPTAAISEVGFSEVSDDFGGYMVITGTDATQTSLPLDDISFITIQNDAQYPAASGTCYLYEVDSWLSEGVVDESIDKSIIAGNWWYQFSEEGLEINGEIDCTVMDGYYGCLGFYLDPDTVNKYFDLASSDYGDIASTDGAIFYPLDGEMNEVLSGWNAYLPGQWYDAEGNPSNWQAGYAYWYYQIYDGQWYDFNTADGYMRGYVLLGQRPGNPKIKEGEVYTQYSVLNEKRWVVNISYRNVPQMDDPYEDTKAYTGEGVTEEGHRYAWDINEDAINVSVTINMDSLYEGAWEMASFFMGTEALSELIGQDMTQMGTDLAYFYPVEPDGGLTGYWSSYAPGQWVDAYGYSSDWANGILYWQYQCVDNYDGHNYRGEFVVGTNPTNVLGVSDGTTVVSKASLCGIDFIVTVNFRTTATMQANVSESGSCTYRDLDSWINAGVVNEEIDESLVSGLWSYEITASGITINGRINAAIASEYEPCIGFYLSPDTIAKYMELDPAVSDINSFYPVGADGDIQNNWSAYSPGQWYDAQGEPTEWGEGPAFWYYQIYADGTYELLEDENNFKPGYFVMGRALNAQVAEGEVYTSRAEFNGKSWVVNISFYNVPVEYDDPDTATGQGTTDAGHSYSWEIGPDGISVNCTVKCDALTGSWEMFSFVLGRKQISELIGENIGQIGNDIEKFYPVEPDGTPGEWTSYIPGQWVDADGAAANWSNGVLYWQYQCVKNYDGHETLGEFVVGTNPGNTPQGGTVVSKAMLCGYPFVVTVTFN